MKEEETEKDLEENQNLGGRARDSVFFTCSPGSGDDPTDAGLGTRALELRWLGRRAQETLLLSRQS